MKWGEQGLKLELARTMIRRQKYKMAATFLQELIECKTMLWGGETACCLCCTPFPPFPLFPITFLLHEVILFPGVLFHTSTHIVIAGACFNEYTHRSVVQTDGVARTNNTVINQLICSQAEVGDLYNLLGTVYLTQHKVNKGIKTLKHAEKLYRAVLGPSHKKSKTVARTLQALAVTPKDSKRKPYHTSKR